MIQFILSTFLFSFGWTQTEPYLKVSFEAGKVPTLFISDTHEAVLRKKQFSPQSVHLLTEIVGSDCSMNLPQAFNYYFGLKVHMISWDWIKHPDPDRLNKPVRLKFDSFKQDLVTYGVLTNHILQELDKDLPLDTMDPILKDSQLHILQWANQNQSFNPETGQLEEKLSTYMTDVAVDTLSNDNFNLQLKPNKNNLFELSTFPFYPFGTNTIWLIKSGNEICEIILKPEKFENYYQAFQEYLKLSPLVNEPYTMNSDDWTSYISNSQTLTNLSFVDGVIAVLE